MAGADFVERAVRARVPATSANLGPGFDALGLALGLHDEVEAQVAPDGLRVVVRGEGAETVSTGPDHLVVRAMRATFDALGTHPPGLRLTCTNSIPHGRGLGSSAAAIIAGVVAARALVVDGATTMDDDRALAVAARLEGHPDNVAACLFGGFTIAWTEHCQGRDPAHDTDPDPDPDDDADQGSPRAVALQPASGVSAVVFVPAEAVATERARGLLPGSVPHTDAARNAGRAALLVEALTRRPELLLAATEDRLHQDYRSPAMPRSMALVEALRSRGVPAVISGAGPTVLALVHRDGGPDPESVAALGSEAAAGFTVHLLPVASEGARVL